MDLAPVLAWLGQFFLDVFLLGFCRDWPLPLILALLVLLVTERLGKAYGVRWLIRHQDPVKQLVVGWMLSMLAVKVLFVGYLLETRRSGERHSWMRLLDISSRDIDPLGGYLVGVFVSFVLLLLVIAAVLTLLNAVVRSRSAPCSPEQVVVQAAPAAPPVPRWPLWAGGCLNVLTVVAILALVRRFLQPPLTDLGRWVFDTVQRVLGSYDRLPPAYLAGNTADTLALHGLALWSTALSLLFYAVIVPWRWRWFSPAVALCFLLNVAVAVYGFLSFFVPGALPILFIGALVLLALGGLSRYKLRLPGLDYRQLQPLNRYPLPKAAPVPTSPVERRRPLAVVCASGGGLRSAAWTTAMLAQLEEQFAARAIAFPYRVRLITGASGGMVGASYYASTLEAPDPARPEVVRRRGGLERSALLSHVARDCLSRVVYRMAYGDFATLFSPLPRTSDRGMALEKAWSENLDGALDCTFADLRAGEEAGWRPALVFSPMMVEDGRRLLISNLDLSGIVENSGNVLRDTRQVYSLTALEFFRLFPQAKDFRLSTAVRLSASFPYFAPAAELPTWPRRRVVDAGYYDNYGVSVAAAWLFQNRDWVVANASGVVFIQLRDGLSQAPRTHPAGTGRDDSTVLSRGLEWASSPPEGLLNAREWTTSFRNDERLQLLTEFFDQTVGDLYFTTVAFEYPGEASLSWYLTDAETASIRAAAAEVGSLPQMAELLAWWQAH
jgi:predicted acylesterase/phospholipase RssA